VIYILAAGAGIVGGFLFVILLKVGFFLFGAVVGCLIGMLILGATPLAEVIKNNTTLSPGAIQLIVILGLGLLLGIVTVILARPILIIGTSFGGAYVVGTTVDSQWIHTSLSKTLTVIFDWSKPFEFDMSDWKPYTMLGGIAVLAIIGAIVQFCLTGKENKPESNGYQLTNVQEYQASPEERFWIKPK